jgi:hypothetical protein
VRALGRSAAAGAGQLGLARSGAGSGGVRARAALAGASAWAAQAQRLGCGSARPPGGGDRRVVRADRALCGQAGTRQRCCKRTRSARDAGAGDARQRAQGRRRGWSGGSVARRRRRLQAVCEARAREELRRRLRG